jgi:DNA-binding NtrC family response regulator
MLSFEQAQMKFRGDDMEAKSKILVVDDDEVVRASYRRSLDSARCNVGVAWNGDEALQAMEQDPYDVILLDLRMPGLDGMSVLKTIKEKWPDSEVVVITGYPSLESAKEAVRLGAYGYLAKPVGPDDVINAAHGAMSQKKWALHKDHANQDEEPGKSPGSRSQTSHHAY